MRGRDLRLRIVKQPPSQSLAPHLGLPKGILLAVVEGTVVPHNPHFLLSNPSPRCVGWTSCLASHEWGRARTVAPDFCVKLQKTDFPCPFDLLRRGKLPCGVKERQDSPVSRSWGMEAAGQQPVRPWSCQQAYDLLGSTASCERLRAGGRPGHTQTPGPLTLGW